jgi:hypothetical protein
MVRCRAKKEAGISVLHVGHTARCTLLPISVPVCIRASIEFTVRPIAMGGGFGRKMASATPEAACFATFPFVLESIPPPERRDGAE